MDLHIITYSTQTVLQICIGYLILINMYLQNINAISSGEEGHCGSKRGSAWVFWKMVMSLYFLNTFRDVQCHFYSLNKFTLQITHVMWHHLRKISVTCLMFPVCIVMSSKLSLSLLHLYQLRSPT